MGDSITWGWDVDVTTNGGYRQYLEDFLQSDGVFFDFVGSQDDGDEIEDGDNEAYNGINMVGLRSAIVSGNLIAAQAPDLILLKIGTNDVVYGGRTNQTDLRFNRLRPLLDTIEAQAGSIPIVVSAIMPCGSGIDTNTFVPGDQAACNSRVAAFNATLYAEIASRNAAGKPYYWVNNDGWLESYIISEGGHPNESGHYFLATKWKAVLDTYNLLPAPSPPGLLHDFNDDLILDFAWRNRNTGAIVIDELGALGNAASTRTLPQSIGLPWQFHAGDFNRDGDTDFLWRNPVTGSMWIQYMDDGIPIGGKALAINIATPWELDVDDFNLDGHPDLLWRNSNSGTVWVQYLNNGNLVGARLFPINVGQPWRLHTADVNRDRQPDAVWRNTNTGVTWVQYLTAAGAPSGGKVFSVSVGQPWQARVLDHTGDGHPDIVYRNFVTGAVWFQVLVNGNQTNSLTSSIVRNGPVWDLLKAE